MNLHDSYGLGFLHIVTAVTKKYRYVRMNSATQFWYDVILLTWKPCNIMGLPGGFARNFNIWGGVGWGGDDNVPCNCTHLGATQLLFLALAHISMLRNWCFLHLHTSRCYATDVSCTCTHLDATQLMFLALAHISVLRNWCFLQLHTSRCYATDVSCPCTHLGATQLMFLARAHIWVLRNWCSWHLHTSRCYATDVLCNCTHLGATQLMFLALAHISMRRNWSFPQQDAPVKLHQTACMANRVKWRRCKLQAIVDFSARFGEKNWRLDIVKTFNDQLHLKTWYAVYFWKNTFYMEKHRKINTMIARTTNGCRYSAHVVTVDIVPSRANPPGGANIMQPYHTIHVWYILPTFGWFLW